MILGGDESGGYIMGGDVFVFPNVDDPAQQAAQEKLAELMMAPETQIEFNKKKGSVPVRLDVDVSSMDVCAQKGMAALQDPARQIPERQLPDHAGHVRRAAGRDHGVLEHAVDGRRHLRRELRRRDGGRRADLSLPAGADPPAGTDCGRPGHGHRHPAPARGAARSRAACRRCWRWSPRRSP